MLHIRTALVALVALLTLSVANAYAQSTSLPYAIYIPMALDGRPATQQPTPQPTQPPIDTLAFRREVIRLVNEYRVANGCPAAAENPILMDAAQAWSDYMQANNLFEHSSVKFPQWYTSRGYTRDAQENIASGHISPEEVVTAWKNSPNHNRTLLWCYYAKQGYVYDLGVGLNGRLWTLALGEHLP